MTVRREYTRWAILRPGNRLTPDYLMGQHDTKMTKFYLTREEARKDEGMRKYNAMLRRRRDLMECPHWWRAKRPVKVKVIVETIE